MTGIDPLAFEGILELLATARDEGFERLELHGPSTRLADEAFCRRILEASPPRRFFHVPLYGADATTHDAVVGCAGAFDRVMGALDNLTRLTPRHSVTIHTVCTRRVLPALAQIVALARARDLSFAADLAFPEQETESDPYRRVAPRQHEVADALVATELDVEQLARVSGLWPCALHARLDADRAARLRQLVDERRLRAPGIGARTPMQRCPHADTCRWIPACSGEILRAYIMLHGDEELAPR